MAQSADMTVTSVIVYSWLPKKVTRDKISHSLQLTSLSHKPISELFSLEKGNKIGIYD
jgi:hypothetical protein